MTPEDIPLVSIVIPCYRQGHFLGLAIESALAQTCASPEIIVVDDGSDDCTGAVAQAFGSKVRYLRHANAGPAAARNYGISQARGKYLVFLDADDILHPRGIEELLAGAQEREEVLGVMGVRQFDNDKDLSRGTDHLPPRSASLVRCLLRENFNPPVAFLCSRKMVLAVGGFDRSLRVDACEDWDLWLRLVFAGALIVPVYKIGAYYRQHPGSHSRNYLRMAQSRSEVKRRSLLALRQAPEFVRAHKIDMRAISKTLKRDIAENHMDAAYQLRQEGRCLAAFRQYYRSIREGQCTCKAVIGMCKIVPHRALRGFGVRHT